MIRFVVIPLILVLAVAIGWIYLGPGNEVSLVHDGVSYSQDLRNVILGAILAVVAIIALWTLITWLWQLPGRIKSGLGLRRRDQALTAMEDALIAGAEGNPELARKKAERARSLIQSPTLGRIVSAQAAEASGDRVEAMARYTEMLDDPKTVPTAQRGLAQSHMAQGDYASAIEHAHLAYSQNRDARWAFDILFRAQVSAHCWADALQTLGEGESRKHIDADTARRRRVVLETALADRYEETGRAEDARDVAVAAASRDPEFAPAVALAARLLKRVDEPRRARKLIEAAWSRRPHPALGMAYRDVIEGSRSRFSRKSIETLIDINPDHRESRLLDAEQAISGERFVEAWSILTHLLESETPSSRLCLLAARCEAGLGNESDARVWMERAATAPTEGDWSDLDPSGDAFAYGDPDWHRLVFSYGERGELIHPRLERNAPTLKATSVPMAAAYDADVVDMITQSSSPDPVTLAPGPVETAMTEPDIPIQPIAQPNCVLHSGATDDAPAPSRPKGSDIASRLDRLLGDKDS